MKVLYLHQYFVPPTSAGGTRSYEFARRLIDNGHEVCMITSAAGLPLQYQDPTRRITEVEIAGIPTVVIQVPYSNAMSFGARLQAFLQFALWSTVAALRHPADVVFATSTPLTIALPGIAAKLWHRIPMVFEVRDLWPEMPIAIGALRNPLAQRLARLLEWTAYHAAAHVVALSPGMAEGVIRQGIASNKVTVIPNSCDVEMFDVPACRGHEIRANRLHLDDDQPLIVYTGTFGQLNGVDYLVDVAAAMQRVAPEVRFLLVGEGAEAARVREHAAETGVLDQTLWIWAPLPKNEMPALLAAATVATSLFVPLRPMWNNSANKFFDALAAGKPVAINYGGWQADLLIKSGAGIVLPSDDPEQAAELLAALVRAPGRLRQSADAARQLAMTEFHRDMMAAKLDAVLHQVVQK